MVNCYREIYGLNGQMKELVKETSNLKGFEIYALPPFDMGFVEISASTKTQIKDLDKQFVSRIISFCEKQNVEKHFLGPLETF